MARIELATYRSTSGCSATEPHPQRCQRWGERRSNPRLPGFNRALGPSQLPPHDVRCYLSITSRIRRGAGRNRTVLEQGCNLLPEPLGHGAANTSPRAHQLQFPLSRRYRSPGGFSRQVPEFPTGLLLRGGPAPARLAALCESSPAAPGFSRIALERIRASLLMLPTWEGLND